MAALLFLLFTQIIFCSAASEWSYKYQDAWPNSCKGKEQSPIEITSTETATACFRYFEINRATFEKKKITVTNTGHSVEIRFLNNTSPPTISGGGLDGEYVLEAFHFHWPSEHIINGHRYPLEGHFVYYSEKYANLRNALTRNNGVAVLGVFYEIVPSLIKSAAFDFVREIPLAAHEINQPVFARVPIALKDLLPKDCDKFYRYRGSLTTPNCNEGVIWTLFKRRQFISPSQFYELTRIWNEEDMSVSSNYRALQRRNGRPIFDEC